MDFWANVGSSGSLLHCWKSWNPNNVIWKMVLLRFELRLQDSKSCVLTWLDDSTECSPQGGLQNGVIDPTRLGKASQQLCCCSRPNLVGR